VVGEGLPAAGSCRFRRPPEACEFAPGLENTPQRPVSLESNEKNFLFFAQVFQLVHFRSKGEFSLFEYLSPLSTTWTPCAVD
jgi:hypothetical protein